MTDPRYPIGKFHYEGPPTTEQQQKYLAEIEQTPANLRAAVKGLSDQQLNTPYRPEGWTVRQVTHHVPDSHLNAYVRCKLALTEDEPTIRLYHEDRWAELPEASSAPIEPSLALLESLHRRWDLALRGMAPSDWERPLVHPESGRQSVGQLVALYGWHGRHHVAHITELRQRMGW